MTRGFIRSLGVRGQPCSDVALRIVRIFLFRAHEFAKFTGMYIGARLFRGGTNMPRHNNLSRMSIDSLVELRDSISAILFRRVADIQRQLSSLGGAIMPSGPDGNSRS